MQRYDAVLFDVDGTLIHSRPGIFNCFAYAFRKMGLDPDAIDCSRYLGPPLRWSFAQHFATDAEVEQAVEYYRVHYEEVGSHQCSLFPGVRQMMDTLKDAGLYMATATCKPVEVVTPILKEQGLFDYFGPHWRGQHGRKCGQQDGCDPPCAAGPTPGRANAS